MKKFSEKNSPVKGKIGPLKNLRANSQGINNAKKKKISSNKRRKSKVIVEGEANISDWDEVNFVPQMIF